MASSCSGVAAAGVLPVGVGTGWEDPPGVALGAGGGVVAVGRAVGVADALADGVVAEGEADDGGPAAELDGVPCVPLRAGMSERTKAEKSAAAMMAKMMKAAPECSSLALRPAAGLLGGSGVLFPDMNPLPGEAFVRLKPHYASHGRRRGTAAGNVGIAEYQAGTACAAAFAAAGRASKIRFIAASSWAADRNQASKTLGGR